MELAENAVQSQTESAVTIHEMPTGEIQRERERREGERQRES